MPSKVEKFKVGNREISKSNYEKHQKFNPATGCIEWTGVKSNIGYGFIGFIDDLKKRGMMTVHRVALALKLGRPVAVGMNANHTCHNRLCVTPEHLVEGTQKQKRRDMVRDGIGTVKSKPRGSLNRRQARQYKYSEQDIQWVRNATTTEIMQKYGVTKTRAASMRYSFQTNYTWLPWDKKS